MGDKVPPCSVSNILDIWLRTVTRIALSCTAIQAESDELFGVIIKCIFVKIFRKFQRHCFSRFSRDVELQRLREGPRYLLVIKNSENAPIHLLLSNLAWGLALDRRAAL